MESNSTLGACLDGSYETGSHDIDGGSVDVSVLSGDCESLGLLLCFQTVTVTAQTPPYTAHLQNCFEPASGKTGTTADAGIDTGGGTGDAPPSPISAEPS